MLLPPAVVLVPGYDYMIAQRYAQQLPSRCELLGEGDVLLTGVRIAGWVVVRHDYTGGAVGDGVGENFAGMRQNGVECANSDGTLGDKPLPTIKAKYHKVLLLARTDVG